MVVDDEEDIRDIICCSLLDQGFYVEVASGGRAALEKMSRGQFDIVLTDINMPEGDGFFLLETVRKFNIDSPKIYLMSGHLEMSVKNYLQKGANGFFQNRSPSMSLFILYLDS